ALPQAREEADQDVERGVRIGVREQCSGLAALDQHRPAFSVVGDQVDGGVAVPDAQRVGLVLCLAMRVDQLQHQRLALALGADGVARGALRIRLADAQPPLLGTFGQELRYALEPVAVRQTGAGHRYAFACLFASDGSFARMSSRCARSSSAEMTL